ncbi:hypothetical protein SAMN05660895_1378 [Thermoflavifilum thermophilum]|uniref:Uncharacterized protein n=1 Tax=Thermoflavifilum thermophilum TaxID=1393122 RepID=A0A1I7NDB8_9BACT|nr:hypothetical protein SAMN05660895_1378 [Thermoflavifilum thermophilum]
MWIYLTSISGMAISVHFCCGQLDTVKLSVGMKNIPHDYLQLQEPCCSDFTTSAQIHDVHQLSSFALGQVEALLPQHPLLLASFDTDFLLLKRKVSDSFPLHSPPLFVLHQVWLI